jgi:hypothetical protein
LICRNTTVPEVVDPPESSIPDAREGVMSAAGNALLWTIGLFVLSFAAIFVVYVADKMRQNLLGRP